MGKGCSHHNHSHGHSHANSDGKISWAVGINVLLTVAQLVGGIFAGSLALIADAIHNFSDAGALLLALIARKIARRAPDEKRTYGYKKVETLAAFTNFLIIVLIAIWLAVEAVMRFFDPVPIVGQTMLVLAGIALVIDIGTALLIRKEAKTNQNMRAAYLHNLADAASSVGVMVAGLAIIYLGWTWLDPLITLFISVYIIIHALHDLPDVINILIDGKSADLSAKEISSRILEIDGVDNIHHIHLRQTGEGSHAMEAHIVLSDKVHIDQIKTHIKTCLEKLDIHHSTLEFETAPCNVQSCH